MLFTTGFENHFKMAKDLEIQHFISLFLTQCEYCAFECTERLSHSKHPLFIFASIHTFLEIEVETIKK